MQLLSASEYTPVNSPRPLMVSIKDTNQLHLSYMPFLKYGGIFLPTNSHPAPGSKVMILLTFLNEPTKRTISGIVSWITPANASMGLMQGIGVAFEDTAANRELKDSIEKALATLSNRQETKTQTM